MGNKSEKFAKIFCVCSLLLLFIVFIVIAIVLKINNNNKDYEYESLSVAYVELESKYDEVYDRYIKYNHLYADIKNEKDSTSNNENETTGQQETTTEQETTRKRIDKDEINIEMPTLPIEVSYVSWGETKVTTRIDKVTYTYKTYSDGTCSLTLYYSGEKLYDVEGEEGLNPCHFDIILYDENGNPVVRETGSGGWLKTGEVFKDQDDLILDVPLGHNYTLEIVNYD